MERKQNMELTSKLPQKVKEIDLDLQHLKEFHLEELADCRYYYGNLSSEATKTLLEDKQYGTYLIKNGPPKSKFPLTLVVKTDNIHYCMVESNRERTYLKVHFNNPEVRPKKLPTLPLTTSYGLLETFSPETHLNKSIIGGLLPNIYKFNRALSYPLRRNVTLSLKDLTRLQILKSLNNNFKSINKLRLPKPLIEYITDWKTCDQDLDRFS